VRVLREERVRNVKILCMLVNLCLAALLCPVASADTVSYTVAWSLFNGGRGLFLDIDDLGNVYMGCDLGDFPACDAAGNVRRIDISGHVDLVPAVPFVGILASPCSASQLPPSGIGQPFRAISASSCSSNGHLAFIGETQALSDLLQQAIFVGPDPVSDLIYGPSHGIDALRINNAGDIIVSDGRADTYYLLVPIPEPVSVLLVASGLAFASRKLRSRLWIR